MRYTESQINYNVEIQNSNTSCSTWLDLRSKVSGMDNKRDMC